MAVTPEVVFLVPGLLCDATIWMHQVRILERRFDVRIPDLTSCETIDSMADVVLDRAPSQFSIAGHSMGARVALQVVAREPARVRRLALLDTGTHPRTEGEAEKRQILLKLSATEGMRALAERWLPPMVREGALDRSPELRAALFAMVERMSPAIHRNQIAALLARPDARAGLSSITCPVLVGVGEFDVWSPPAQHEAITKDISHARFVLFPDSGHMAPIEAPEAVTNAIEEWMQMEPAG